MTVEFRILGPLELLRDGERVDLGGPRQRALLALLVTRANATVSRDRIIDELWADEPPESVVNVLQTYVSRLRRVLPEERLASRAPGYVLVVADEELDLRAFERGAEEGRTRASTAAAACTRAVSTGTGGEGRTRAPAWWARVLRTSPAELNTCAGAGRHP